MGEVLPGHLDRRTWPANFRRRQIVNTSVPQSYGDNLSPEETRTLYRAIGASAMGNAIEWYDYGIYAYLVTAVGANFFPAHDPAAQTLSAFAVFIVPFVIRPFGAAVFGTLGDRIGRQRILALTVILISGGTFLIGLIPSYATIGVAAPVLLVLLRLVQGLSAGGEYGGAATFMAEYSPDKRRGFFGSFLEFGTLAGYILGAGVTTITQLIVGTDAMSAWGWRIPFLLALPLGAVGLYMRTRLEDTPVFRELAEQGLTEHETKTEFKDLLRHWRPILICMGLVLFLNITDYTLLSYMPTYLQTTIDLTANGALIMTIIVYAAMMAVITFVGRTSDRVGRKPVWAASALGFIVLSLPSFWLMSQGSWGLTIIGFAVLGLLLVLQLGIISATFPALFPTQVRYAGFAISYNVSTALFGGTAPFVNDFMIPRTSAYWPAFYMMAAAVIGLIALWFTPETAGASMRGTQVPHLATSGPDSAAA
jgi:MFS transporter, MHS family, proline/betaine transporter